MSDPTECRECGSSDLYWFSVNVNKTGVAEGRLRTHEPTCRFVLGCHDCSETLKAVDADRIAERMNSEQSELAALREELAASFANRRALDEEASNLQVGLTAAEQRNASLLETARGLTIQLHATIGNTELHDDCIRDLEALKPTESGASDDQ